MSAPTPVKRRSESPFSGAPASSRRSRVALSTTLPLLLLLLPAICISQPKHEILVLHSYHKNFEWTDSEMSGLHDQLMAGGMQFESYIEYLDTKRFPDPERLGIVLDGLVEKYWNKEFDAVVTADDNALYFLLENREALAPGVPVVFCGINTDPAPALVGVSGVTGVLEGVSLRETIDVALDLHPGTREIVVAYDRTTTNLALIERMETIEPDYSGRVDFRYLEAESMEDLITETSLLGPGSIVLFLNISLGLSGSFLDYHESIARVREAVAVPLYSSWDFYMGHGIVGGRMTNGRMQGATAGAMVNRILRGTPADSIPILTESPNQFMFDDVELRRFGVDHDRLPPGSTIINQPHNFYEINRRIIHIVAGVLFFLVAAIFVLAHNILQRRRAERALLAERGRLKRALAHESLLAESAELLNMTDDHRSVLGRLLERMIEEMRLDKVSLYSFAENTKRSSVIESRVSERGVVIPDEDIVYFGPDDGVYTRILRNERIVVDDIATMAPYAREICLKREIGSVVILPVQVAGRIMGVLGFSRIKPHNWRSDEIAVFATMADMVANAWERQEQIRARREAEQRHIEAVRTLEESVRMASLGVMAAGITHEISQPLNAIKVTTDSALFWDKHHDGEIPERIKTKLRQISDGAERIDAIVRHMRRFRTTREELRPVDMNAAVRSAFSLVESQVHAHGIACRLELCRGPLWVLADELQMEQIVINMAINAVHALDEVDHKEKMIRIVTRDEGESAWLEVHDNGVGLPEEEGFSIFDPFFSTRTEGIGTGLGLAIVKLFVESFGGEIRHQDNDDGGASFLLRLNPATAGGGG